MVLKIYRQSSFIFHFVGSTEKVSPVKGKIHFLMSLYTYLALRISNPVGKKISRWRLGINSFGANWDLSRNYTQRGHCHAGAKLSRSHFVIFPLGANLVLRTDSTLRRNFSAGVQDWTFVEDRTPRRYFPAGAKLFPCWVVSLDRRRSCLLHRNCIAGTKFSGWHFVLMGS